MRTLAGRCRWPLAILLIAALLATPVHAEGLAVSVERVDAAQFPVVRAYVSVASATGVPVAGLDPQAFQVQEDGKPVDALAVEAVVDSQEPIAVAFVIDVSGSMADQDKLKRAQDAATAFVDTLGSSDRVTLVSFADTINVVQDYTADRPALKSAIGSLAARGDTALYDAVAQTLRREAAQPERRRALVLLTDGQDTRSKASLDDDVTASASAGTPVYAIGLGSDVSRDVLDRIASSSGGQAVYLDTAAQLRSTFLSIGDQLRRHYVLRYASRLPQADTAAHGLAVQAAYSGQQATALATFKLPTPPAVTVSGLPASGTASNVQHVMVDVPAGAQLVQLLVDDRVRGTSHTAPCAFDWDTSLDQPGQHRVVVRVTDPNGASFDQPFTIATVAPVPPPPAPAPNPPPPPTPVPAAPTPTVAPVAPSAVAPMTRFDAPLTLAALVILLLAAGVTWILATSRARIPSVKAPAAAPDRASDATEVVDDAPDDMTLLRGGVRRIRPARARLLITRRGEEREVVLDQADAVVGRDAAVNIPIDDPLASRQHCRIVRGDDVFWLEDMRSLNGTQVNGEPISRRQLVANDRISIGETVLTFKPEPR